MSYVTKAELQALVTQLNQKVEAYDDSAAAGANVTRAEVRGAARTILNATLDENEKVFDYFLMMNELISVRTLSKIKAFDHIPVDGSISSKELAQKTKSTHTLIERLARPLVATGFLDQTRPDGGDYRHTRLSKPFADIEVASPATNFLAIYDAYFKPAVTLDDFVQSKFATSGVYTEPNANTDNPFIAKYAHTGATVWDTMGAMPDLLKNFQFALRMKEGLNPAIHPDFNYAKFKLGPNDDPERKEWVDVGGANGFVISQVLTHCKELDSKKCVLQDVKPALETAHKARELGVQTMPIDFHAEQPIRGAKAYYMRAITHDYSDDEAINILSVVSRVMAPDSTLILADSIVPDRVTESTLTGAIADGIMFAIGGLERTEDTFRYILDQAGLQVIGISRLPGVPGSLIESRLKVN